MASETGATIPLPEPRSRGSLSLEATLAARRSVRDFAGGALTLDEMAQLLWAAQGITEPRFGLRAAPSAGALYPLEMICLAGEVEGLAPDVYRYRPAEHTLVPLGGGDRRAALAEAAAGQDWIAAAPCILVLCGVYARTSRKYGERGTRYVHIEVGHAGQNVYLQGRALGLGTTIVGAFRDREVQRLLGLAEDEAPLALLPVGRLP
jgi:SagB-type dehydrogenase family enzyme